MEATEHAHPHAHDPAIRGLAADWWDARREIRQAAIWEVPFPPRSNETVRVTHAAAGDDAGMWYAALLRPRAMTAYLEVHSTEGPIGALVSLYEHVV